MDYRRGGRPSQVRPRPYSGSSHSRIRSSAPSPTRLSRHRSIERRRGLPLLAKVALGGGVLVFAWLCLFIGVGLVGPATSSLVRSFGSMVGSLAQIVSSPTPSSSGGPVSGAPVIQPPGQATTNVGSVDLTVLVPSAIVGQQGYSCKLYVTLPHAQPTVVTQTPVGGTSMLVLPSVPLAKGANAFTATVVGPGGESTASAPVIVTLDVTKPTLAIITPKNGASVSGASVAIKGKTEAGSEIRITNDANGATANAAADANGLFATTIAIAAGPNNLTFTITDAAGNGNTATLSVTKGSGKLHVTLSSSVYQFTARRLPTRMTLTATVIGADGKPVAGASALFTVSVPGLPAVVSSVITTNAKGTATFSTTIPKGAMAGSGVADVLITMPNGTQTATDRAALTVR